MPVMDEKTLAYGYNMEINLTPYLIFMGCSVAACILWFFLSVRKELPAGRAAALSGLTLILGIVLGIAGARLVWFLCRINIHPALFSLKYDELSYYGGAAGVTLAVWLSAKVLGLSGRGTLNSFAPMGAFLAAMVRFAEGFLAMEKVMLGVGAWMEEGIFFPVTVEFVYDESYSEFYLAVFMFEGLFSLIAMVLSLYHKNDRDRFLRTMYYLCLPQIFCESLRAMSIKWLFVRSEQLFCFLFCEGVLIWHGIRKKEKMPSPVPGIVFPGMMKKERYTFLERFSPALVGLLVCGVVIVAEFALDGKILFRGEMIPKWVTYGFVLAGLAAMAAAEHKARLPEQ